MKDRKFTFIELLAVVAIIAILTSLLLPSLARARYEANTAVCAANLKQVGNAYTAYAKHNNRYYAAHAKWEDLKMNGGTIDSRYYVRTSLQTIAHDTFNPLSTMLPYWGGSNREFLHSMRLAYTCPLVAQKYEANARRLDLNGDGVKETVGFPYRSTHAYVTTYSMWPNFYRSDSTHWSVDGYNNGVMRILGEPWKLGRKSAKNIYDVNNDDAWSHVIGSDQNSGKYWNAGFRTTRMQNNHWPLGKHAYIDTEWKGRAWQEPENYAGFDFGANGYVSGWMSIGTSFASNYLIDDGSVDTKKGLNKTNAIWQVGGTGFAVPKEYFQEGK